MSLRIWIFSLGCQVYLFRTTVSHAVRVAKVRRHVQQLLANRHFIKASLERKALWILECPDTPPLRLLHWSEISKTGQLPKYQHTGSQGEGLPKVDHGHWIEKMGTLGQQFATRINKNQ